MLHDNKFAHGYIRPQIVSLNRLTDPLKEDSGNLNDLIVKLGDAVYSQCRLSNRMLHYDGFWGPLLDYASPPLFDRLVVMYDAKTLPPLSSMSRQSSATHDQTKGVLSHDLYRDDVYAFGGLIYFVATGRSPNNILEDQSIIPPLLLDLMRKCMQYSITASEIIFELETLLLSLLPDSLSCDH